MDSLADISSSKHLPSEHGVTWANQQCLNVEGLLPGQHVHLKIRSNDEIFHQTQNLKYEY